MGEGDVGIDFCRTNVLVAQKKLDRTDVETVFEKMGGKGVTQDMGGKGRGDSGGPAVFLDEGPEGLAGKRMPVPRDEKFGPVRIPAGSYGLCVLFDEAQGLLVEKGNPFLCALSDDPDGACLPVEPVGGERGELRDPESGGVEEGQNGPVPDSFGSFDVRGRKKPSDLFPGQYFGQGTGKLWRSDLFGRVFPDSRQVEISGPGPEGRENAGLGSRGEVGPVGEVAEDLLLFEGEKGSSGGLYIPGEGPEVGEVGKDGVFGLALGEEKVLLESVEEAFDFMGSRIPPRHSSAFLPCAHRAIRWTGARTIFFSAFILPLWYRP